jgi:hypothetical protein
MMTPSKPVLVALALGVGRVFWYTFWKVLAFHVSKRIVDGRQPEEFRPPPRPYPKPRGGYLYLRQEDE